MIYIFVCPSCGKRHEVQMLVSEYHANGHYCDCGTELKRDIKDFCTISQRNVEGFYGVETENKNK